MKILLSSHSFAPSIGGIETVSQTLASAFVRAGHRVCVVTQTIAIRDHLKSDYSVVRKPTLFQLWQETVASDVVFQNNISLQTAWPAIFAKKPLAITHATWLEQPGQAISPIHRLKRWVIHRSKSISISHSIAIHVGGHSEIVGNPYDDGTFRLRPGIARTRDLVFVGRLVSDKGVDLLLEALANLKSRGLEPSLSIIGSGPEEQSLRAQSAQLDLGRQVTFAGSLSGVSLAEVLNAHRCLVVPSRWAEPFGIVALEGIACGCAVIGSQEGGLSEAIGPCGVTFPNGDATALSKAIEAMLQNPAAISSCLGHREEHLEPFATEYVAQRYLRIFAELVA